jgi:putative redox protein
MKLLLNHSEKPYVFELTHENGTICKIDSSKDIGGKNMGLTPMELLAGALSACVSIDVLMILQKQRIETKRYAVSVNASKKNSVPSPFEKIHLVIEIDAEVESDKVDRAIKLSIEKYCSVKASLNPDIQISYNIIKISK